MMAVGSVSLHLLNPRERPLLVTISIHRVRASFDIARVNTLWCPDDSEFPSSPPWSFYHRLSLSVVLFTLSTARFRRSYESSPPLRIACGNLTASSASSSAANLTSDVSAFCTSLSLSLVRAPIGKMTLPEGSGFGMIVASSAASSHMPSSSRSLWLLYPAINGHWMSLAMNEYYNCLSCSRIPLY
jgi:hypothetical protein